MKKQASNGTVAVVHFLCAVLPWSIVHGIISGILMANMQLQQWVNGIIMIALIIPFAIWSSKFVAKRYEIKNIDTVLKISTVLYLFMFVFGNIAWYLNPPVGYEDMSYIFQIVIDILVLVVFYLFSRKYIKN